MFRRFGWACLALDAEKLTPKFKTVGPAKPARVLNSTELGPYQEPG